MAVSGSELRIYYCPPGTEFGSLRGLLRRTLASGARALVRTSEELVPDLNRRFWLGEEGGLLPHGARTDGFSERQPVLLLDETEEPYPAPNGAEFLFHYLVPSLAPPPAACFARNFFVLREGAGLDSEGWGNSQDALAALVDLGYDLSLWTCGAGGRWQESPVS